MPLSFKKSLFQNKLEGIEGHSPLENRNQKGLDSRRVQWNSLIDHLVLSLLAR